MEEHDQSYEKPEVRDYGELMEVAASQGHGEDEDRDRVIHHPPPLVP